jgi:ComF family protein
MHSYIWPNTTAAFNTDTIVIPTLSKSLLQLLFPILCAGCNRPLTTGEEVLCLSCADSLLDASGHLPADADAATRLSGRIPFEHAISLLPFVTDGLLQHLLHELKYNGRKEHGWYLGKKLASALQRQDWSSSIDLIVPVPLHSRKAAVRGYNQSMIIARGVAQGLGVAASEQFLVRVRHTESQTKKSRSERLDNMKDAFAVTDPEALKNKHVLLVDDVLTTGATIEACANALLQIENLKISIGVIGIAIS